MSSSDQQRTLECSTVIIGTTCELDPVNSWHIDARLLSGRCWVHPSRFGSTGMKATHTHTQRVVNGRMKASDLVTCHGGIYDCIQCNCCVHYLRWQFGTYCFTTAEMTSNSDPFDICARYEYFRCSCCRSRPFVVVTSVVIRDFWKAATHFCKCNRHNWNETTSCLHVSCKFSAFLYIMWKCGLGRPARCDDHVADLS